MKAEIRVMQLQAMNAKAAHQPHAAGKRQGRISLQVSEECALLPPWFQSSSLKNWKKYTFVVSSAWFVALGHDNPRKLSEHLSFCPFPQE